MTKKKENKSIKKFEFSKLIIVFETILVALVSWKVLAYAEMCIMSQYMGTLAFLTTMITAVWSAYGVSVSFYYNKAKAENVPKIQGSIEAEKEKAAQTQVKVEVSQYTNDVDCDVLM